jgi:septal ring factor EnvC (AmiA/AmiB activator)
MPLKKLNIILFIAVFFILFAEAAKSAAYVSPFVQRGHVFYESSLSIIKKLKLYKLSLNKLYKDLETKKKESNKLNHKIKYTNIILKKLKKKIKNSGYIVTRLLKDIFIINEEKDAGTINLSVKNSNYVISNYILKNLLNHEEYKLNKLVNRDRKFAKINKEIVVEEKRLKKEIYSLSRAKLKLKKIIVNTQNYMNNVYRMKNEKSHANNKNSRFLRKKVIKLIHKIKSKIRNNSHHDIKFIVIK